MLLFFTESEDRNNIIYCKYTLKEGKELVTLEKIDVYITL